MTLVQKCIEIAAIAHRDQKRRTLGHPYIIHPLRVAHMAELFYLGETAVCAALLHDVPEDTQISVEDLHQEKIPMQVLHIVRLLTKWWPDSKESEAVEVHKPKYYQAIMADYTALNVKLLDRADNLMDMARMTELKQTHLSELKWARNYFNKTQREFAPLIDSCIHLEVERNFKANLALLEAALVKKGML